MSTTPNEYKSCVDGGDCAWLNGDVNEPCWGQVLILDEDCEGNWIHGCQGHINTWEWCHRSKTASKYIPKPTL